jgi:Tfp pilus assembly protein PilN
MTLFGSKKGYSKSDINFFEEFTASARKQTQVLAVVVFVGIIAIGLCLAVLAYDIFRNLSVQKDIDDLNATLASDEYAGLELRSQSLQQEINDKNQYFYTLTEMRRIVDETNAAPVDVADLIGDNIPSDAYVDSYSLTGDYLQISGVTFSYYDAVNVAYMLNESDVFANYVVPSVQRDESMNGAEGIQENPIDVYYDFTVSGNLVSDSIISVGHFANTESGVIALSGISTQTVAAGSEYEIQGINTFAVNGVNYSLASVVVNDNTLSPADFAVISANDKISGIANGNVDISLYYNVVTVAETEEGSAE